MIDISWIIDIIPTIMIFMGIIWVLQAFRIIMKKVRTRV